MEALQKAALDKDAEIAKLATALQTLERRSAEKDNELESLTAELKTATERTQSGSGVNITSGDLEKIVDVRDAEIKRLECGAVELRRVLSRAKEENSSLEEQLKSISGATSAPVPGTHACCALLVHCPLAHFLSQACVCGHAKSARTD